MSLFFIQILNFTDKSVLFFLMIRRPPRSTLFPYRRSSDLDAGFLPHAFVNFLCLLGWNPKDNREAMSRQELIDRKSTRLNSSHTVISYAVFCLKKKRKQSADGKSYCRRRFVCAPCDDKSYQ